MPGISKGEVWLVDFGIVVRSIISAAKLECKLGGLTHPDMQQIEAALRRRLAL